MDEISKFKELLLGARHVVFFGGAGVSTESGIPDFRGAEGIYTKYEHLSPETIISRDFFLSRTGEFYDFYKKAMLFPTARPNDAHIALAKLEREGHLDGIITQNIDGLHQAAGSKNVIELHGSVHRNYCMKCGKAFDLGYVLSQEGVPHCDKCGGRIKPDVVLYGELLPDGAIAAAEQLMEKCDLLIVGGTSLGVYPAASFVAMYRGRELVMINTTPTPFDNMATLVIREPIGEVFKKAVL